MDRTHAILRVRLVAFAVVIASVGGFLYLIISPLMGSSTCKAARWRRIFSDVRRLCGAGAYVLDGNPDAAFDPVGQHAREQGIFGETTPF